MKVESWGSVRVRLGVVGVAYMISIRTSVVVRKYFKGIYMEPSMWRHTMLIPWSALAMGYVQNY